jgi:hypothetical protein
MQSTVIVCDGGIDHSLPLSPPSHKVSIFHCALMLCHHFSFFLFTPLSTTFILTHLQQGTMMAFKSWNTINVYRDLFVPTLRTLPTLGLSMESNGCRSWSLIPRQSALDVLPQAGMSSLFASLEQCLYMHSSFSRGRANTIFGDRNERVLAQRVGVIPSMNSAQLLDNVQWQVALGHTHWSRIMKMVRRAELLFDSFAGHEVLEHIRHAKRVVPHKTLRSPDFGDTVKRIPPARYFSGVAFGRNVFLRCHRDKDFTMSMAHVLLEGKDGYNLDDDVIVFFCFPTLGVAVPMRPGDFLLFNSRVPHCISTRCRVADNVMVITMYLKTSVVGGNNNSIPVTNEQEELAAKYCKMRQES